MKVLELFAGTRSIGKAFEARGHEVFSVEWDKNFENINLYEDISKLTAQDILDKFGRPDVIWASPDCTTYSVAAISYHRRKQPNGNLTPMTDYAKFCDETNAHVIELIKELAPKYWFIENPRGGGCARWTSCKDYRATPSVIANMVSADRSPPTFGLITRCRCSNPCVVEAHHVTTQLQEVVRPEHKLLKTQLKRQEYRDCCVSI